MTTPDLVVIIAYLLAVLVLGSVFVKEQKNIGDFFLAGRSFSWFPITLSIVATNLSAITYMGCPDYVFQHDLKAVATALCDPFVIIATVYIVGRMLYKLKIFTVYEYLERRFGVVLRIVASIIFLCAKCGWLATVLYVPSLMLSVVTKLPCTWCVIIIGLFGTFYATMGGMKAVIWTDVGAVLRAGRRRHRFADFPAGQL